MDVNIKSLFLICSSRTLATVNYFLKVSAIDFRIYSIIIGKNSIIFLPYSKFVYQCIDDNLILYFKPSTCCELNSLSGWHTIHIYLASNFPVEYFNLSSSSNTAYIIPTNQVTVTMIIYDSQIKYDSNPKMQKMFQTNCPIPWKCVGYCSISNLNEFLILCWYIKPCFQLIILAICMQGT